MCVCEVSYPGSMLSKAGKNTATEYDQIKICVRNTNRPLSLTRHVHKLGWTGDQIVAGVISNEMPCIWHHEHCLTYCVVSANCNWRSLTENFATVGAVWVPVDPNIRWQYEVLLGSSQSNVRKLLCFTQHVSVVLLVEHHEQLCFIVLSFEAATIQLLSKMCCHFIQWNIWDGFCVIGCGIYVQFRKF